MSNPTSIVEELLQAIPQLRPQLYFKTSLTALSHAMEDQVLAGTEHPLLIASFQQERFYRQEANRYARLADLTDQVYVLSARGTSFTNSSDNYETIAFEEKDALTQEWHLVVMGLTYSACLICRERTPVPTVARTSGLALEQTRRFEGIWTQDRYITQQAALLLLDRIAKYRPELTQKIDIARDRFLSEDLVPVLLPDGNSPDPFVQRLVTYLQAGQYKLLKAYKAISAQEQRERLVNSITSAIRRSLDPDEIFQIAVRELGQALQVCRCLIYPYSAGTQEVLIRNQHLKPGVRSLMNQTWPLAQNPLFEYVQDAQEIVAIEDTADKESPFRQEIDGVMSLVEQWGIRSWMLVPLVHQKRLLGLIELHHCQTAPYQWTEDDKALVDAIAAQLSVALIQAEAYANLQDLNGQLAALDRTRSNLIAITGHELRTPLSTIQVCLESLTNEPDMPLELRQTMLQTALEDGERMRKLVQDFLTLSRLESGRIEWNLESLSLQECVDLALSSVQAHQGTIPTPQIKIKIPSKTPLVRADGEWLVEVLVKLLDNACKFTEPKDTITIQAQRHNDQMMEISVADTGRGIEPDRLEIVFDRFYQEEGALRRTTGGTGLGLAMCRQIVEGMGGQIWATSDGRDKGSQFHFTLPIAQGSLETPRGSSKNTPARTGSRRASKVQNSVLLDD
ncbi:MAG TPA: DICT sensory domain-containing protein [Leptolyngbyaceae cyanobacterium]